MPRPLQATAVLDNPARLKAMLESLYARHNRPEFIDPDPLAAVLRYSAPEDREIVGLIAASLAFGNVKQILRSIDAVLSRFPRPHADLLDATPRDIHRRLHAFRHRFVGQDEMSDLLLGMRRILLQHGRLGTCFAARNTETEETVLPALSRFVQELRKKSRLQNNYLLPIPEKGSACKRLLLYLRWMVRRDAVDPGGWTGVRPAQLLVPMDTHMHRMALALGLTERKSADLKTSQEVTASFRRICPEDPVRYDFALTRFGIRKFGELHNFLYGNDL